MRDTVAVDPRDAADHSDPEAASDSVRAVGDNSWVGSNLAAGTRESLRPDVGPGPWGIRMAQTAVGLAGGRKDLDAIMDAIACDAAQAIPGTELAALVTRQPSDASLCLFATSAEARTWVELEAGVEGPCTSALAGEVTIRVDDLAAADGWLRYREQGLAAGIAGVICLPLAVNGRLLGALALYSRVAHAFTDETVQGAHLYAAHAAVALAAAQDRANLLVAVDSRDRIGQAKGILMERHKLTDGQAFATLKAVSQNTNTPLRLVAEHLTTTGEVPVPSALESESSVA